MKKTISAFLILTILAFVSLAFSETQTPVKYSTQKFKQQTIAPSAPGTGDCVYYFKSDGLPYYQCAGGAETKFYDPSALTPKAFDQGVNLTAAASGSTGITAPSAARLNMGIGHFTSVFRGLIPDVTPAADIILAQKHDGTNGWILTLLTTGHIRIKINATNYDSTATLASVGIADGAVVKLGWAVTRSAVSAAGSIQPYINGRVLGSAIAITAGAPVTVDNTAALYIMGTSATRTAGVANAFILYNRPLSSAQMLDLTVNGINIIDVGASQAAFYTANYSATSDGWTATNGTVSGNNDSITDGTTSKDNVLKYYADATNTASHLITKTIADTGNEGKNVKIKFYYYIPNGQTNVVAISIGNTLQPTAIFSGVGAWTYAEVDLLRSSATLAPRFTARNAAGTAFSGTNSANDDRFYIADAMTLEHSGVMVSYLPEGITPVTWIDSSSNLNHATYPLAGSSLVRPYRGMYQALNDTTLSGTPKVFTIYDTDGTPFYFKAYPTKQ